MAINSFEQLDVWKRAMDLVTEVYRATKGFPKEETYGLMAQVRRAVVSVPSNIAEGQGRRSTKEFLNHLSYARGSLMEVRTQLEVAARLDYLPEGTHGELKHLAENVAKLLNGLIRSLQAKE